VAQGKVKRKYIKVYIEELNIYIKMHKEKLIKEELIDS